MTSVSFPQAGKQSASLPRKSNRRRYNTLIAWAFCGPFIALFATFYLWPLLASFMLGFTDMTSRDLRNPFGAAFVGFENYLALFQDPRFVRSLVNTLYFVAVGVPLTMGLALAIAVVLNSGIGRLKGFFRASFFAPVVTSIVAVAVVWRYLYRDDGLINAALLAIGIDGPNWLSDPAWAMPAMIIMAAWRNIGIPMVIFLAGLQAMPNELYEAARVDGGTRWSSFWDITLPLLRPTLLVVSVLLGMGYLQFFEEPFVMTDGGPLDSTTSLSFYVYDQFGYGQYGVASAASYVLVALIAVFSAAQFRLFRRQD